MADRDFQDYASNVYSSATAYSHQQSSSVNVQPLIQYHLEKRDGSLLHQSLDLNSSVFEILESLAAALKLTGAASLPPPPPLPQAESKNDVGSANQHEWHWAAQSVNRSVKPNGPNNVDNRYDINSNRGRDLHAFLASITSSQIEERRASRLNASAAALVARRLFSFQSVDGIQLGWSSDSFAVLLHSLIRLHEEHHSRFYVKSFYPLRLVFSPDDDSFHFFHQKNRFNSSKLQTRRSLDVYGGNLYLNPAATQLEWLESLQEVMDENLLLFRQHRKSMEDRVAYLHNELGIKIKKGHSCTSYHYHSFLERIVGPLMTHAHNQLPGLAASAFDEVDPTKDLPSYKQPHGSTDLVATSGLSPFTDTVRLVVESTAACRRPKVTAEGSIRIPSDVNSFGELSGIVSKLSSSAHERWLVEQQEQKQCREAIGQAKYELGLQKIYRFGTMVKHHQYLDAMSRLLDQSSQLKGRLSGQSLGIAGAGHFCHLSDDGSLVVPHNWC